MISGGVFRIIVILLGCAIVYTSGGKGKQVLLKIHVPELIKHQHHTNIVFVHKHHHHPVHHDKKQHKHHHHHHHHHDHKDHDKGHHAHSFGGHYSHSHGEPPGYHHSHSYGHQHHYNFGHGDDDHGHGQGHGHVGPKKKTPSHPHMKKGGVGKKDHKHKPHKPHHKSIIKPQDKKKENLYDFEISYKNPLTNTEHYHYESYNPSYTFDNNDNLMESNKSIRHESIEIETTRNESPEVETFKTPTSGNYEVEEPTLDFHTDDDNYEKKPKFRGYSEYYNSEDDEESNKGLGNYAEDYTNPNSVAKYTSDIQHGTINLEDSNYNPEHGNDLEEYIKASQNSDLI